MFHFQLAQKTNIFKQIILHWMRIVHPTEAQLPTKPLGKALFKSHNAQWTLIWFCLRGYSEHFEKPPDNKPCMTDLQHINSHCKMISSSCSLNVTALLNSTLTRTSGTGQRLVCSRQYLQPQDVNATLVSGQEVTIPSSLVIRFVQLHILSDITELSSFVAYSIFHWSQNKLFIFKNTKARCVKLHGINVCSFFFPPFSSNLHKRIFQYLLFFSGFIFVFSIKNLTSL